MICRISDSQKNALVEVSLTIHPEAIREMLSSRNGWWLGVLRLAGFQALLYCALGMELALPRLFPELGLHPVVLLLAYLVMRKALIWPLLLSLFCGILLDAGFAVPLGFHPLLLSGALTGLVLLAKPLRLINASPWREAALSGAVVTLIFSLGNWAFCGFADMQGALTTMGIGTLLAGLAYMPALVFLLDLTARRK
ncbi:MAG: hypothetical protein MJ202_11115 [Lentisphaeria bacterium]|nr:hypothetical protein [Lentisphaeria bacterium]